MPVISVLLGISKTDVYKRQEESQEQKATRTDNYLNQLQQQEMSKNQQVAAPTPMMGMESVSYTHLDVYKRQMKDRALREDFVRVIDVTGEYSTLATELGGRVLNMDGSDGIINLLEICLLYTSRCV